MKWIDTWRKPERTLEKMRRDAADEDALLREAIEPYGTGFRKDLSHYYSGITAVTLMQVLRHLTGEKEEEKTAERTVMEGGVRWAVQSALARNPKDYWARVTLGDLELLVSEKETLERAYRAAVAVAEKDWFALDSSRQQLLLHPERGFAKVRAGYDDQGNEVERTGFDADGKPVQTRMTIVRVLPDSQGQRIGLQPGDIVRAYDGKEVPNSVAALISMRAAEGERLRELKVLRGTEVLSFQVASGLLNQES